MLIVGLEMHANVDFASFDGSLEHDPTNHVSHCIPGLRADMSTQPQPDRSYSCESFSSPLHLGR
jgi:hypothetical protein